MSASLTAHNQTNELWAQAVDNPKAWIGPPGPAWDKLWALREIAIAVEASGRRSGELVGCVYAEYGGCDSEQLADHTMMRCEYCVEQIA